MGRQSEVLTVSRVELDPAELPVRTKAVKREADGVRVYVAGSRVEPIRIGRGVAAKKRARSLRAKASQPRKARIR